MDSLIGLAGAIVGGCLVLIGDFIRRRAERRRDAVRDLAKAATEFSCWCGI
jgi:hypothetical protein